VNDPLGSTQRRESFWTKQAVRVRDDADEDGSSQFSEGVGFLMNDFGLGTASQLAEKCGL